MTDPCGAYPMPMDLLSMAEDVARAMGRFHPGRPAFSALSRAHDALRLAAQELGHAHRTYAPLRGADLSRMPVAGVAEPDAPFRADT
jgi:hypothetical protein